MAATNTGEIAGMARLTFLSLYDSSWSEQVQEFAALNPEFIPFLHVAPGSTGHGKSGLYEKSPSDVEKGGRGGIKEYLKWYALSAGVRATYAYKMWENEGVREGDYSKLTEKKQTIMQAIDTLPEITTEKELRSVKVKGVGAGGMASALSKFFGRTDEVAYTDRAVVAAVKHVYGEDLTLTKVKKKVDGWKGNKSVGESWCFMIYHHVLGK